MKGFDRKGRSPEGFFYRKILYDFPGVTSKDVIIYKGDNSCCIYNKDIEVLEILLPKIDTHPGYYEFEFMDIAFKELRLKEMGALIRFLEDENISYSVFDDAKGIIKSFTATELPPEVKYDKKLKASDSKDNLDKSPAQDEASCVDLLLPNEIWQEEELTEEETEIVNTVRDVYFTTGFKRYYEHADEKIQNNINQIINNLRSKDKKELKDYLKAKTNKLLKGSSHRFNKLYADYSLGHRLVWCSADYLIPGADSDGIIIIGYAEQHDRQGLIGRNFDSNSAVIQMYEKSNQEIADLEDHSNNNYRDVIPPYLFYKERLVPQLNGNQKDYLHIAPPFLLQGCAGSGKTQVSLELYGKLCRKGLKPIYTTFTRELVDEVKDKLHYMADVEHLDFTSSICTVNQLFEKVLSDGVISSGLLDEAEFKKWKETFYIKKSQNKYRKIDSEYAWTYIRGAIKGGITKKDILDRNAFIKWMNSNEQIDSEIAECIYDIYEDYESYRTREHLLDDNDLAAMVMASEAVRNTIPCLIVDEIQDLTFKQINALIHLVSNYNIYMCGDINQRINPTITDLDAIGRLFCINNKVVLESKSLRHSFRSCQGLVLFLNHLSQLRREFVALQDTAAEEAESSYRYDDEGMWATYCDNKEIDIESLMKIISNAANCMVIVPDSDVKAELNRSKYGNGLRVMTVQEMKGLEFDNIILYNFVSSNIEEFKAIFEGERRRNTFARLLFNKLYVACTRARERLIIYENQEESFVKDIVYKNIPLKDSIDDIQSYMNLQDNDESWLKDAKYLESNRYFEMAIHSYERVKERECSKEIERCRLMHQKKMYENFEDAEERYIRLVDIAENLVELEAYKYAAEIYDEIKNDYDEIRVNTIYAKSKAKQYIPHNYISGLLQTVKEEELHDNINKVLPYMEDILRENKTNLDEMNAIIEGFIHG